MQQVILDCTAIISLLDCYQWLQNGFAVATNFVVHNVEEVISLTLKQLAASHGRSAEAEHREILKSVLQRPKRRSVAEVLSSMPNVGEDSDFNFRNVW